jgi:hypothetical protein
MGNIFLPGLLSMMNYTRIFSEMGAQLKSKWVSRRAAEKTSLTARDLPTFFPVEWSSDGARRSPSASARDVSFILYILLSCLSNPPLITRTSFASVPIPHNIKILDHLSPLLPSPPTPPQSLIAGLPAISTFSIKHLYCSNTNSARCNLIGHELYYAALSRSTSIS